MKLRRISADRKLEIIRRMHIEEKIPSRIIVPWYYEHHMHKKLDLKNPTTFNEKLQWLKLNYHNPIMQQLVDKLAVREYIKENIGEEYLIPLIAVYDRFEDIRFEQLPDKFVIKCNHDSGSCIVCKDKKTLDIEVARNKINEHLKKNYYYMWREWPYKHIQPKILIEEYMEDFKDNSFDDYKFLCFNGEVDNVMICTGRQTGNLKFHFFDRDWNFKRYNYIGLQEPENFTMTKPEKMDEMFDIAEKLAKDFPCVRVELYCANEKIYFGEMTFFPQAGFDSNLLEQTDLLWGEKIILKKFK